MNELDYEALEEQSDRHIGRMLGFFAHVRADQARGTEFCWNWPGAVTAGTGYGRVNVGARQIDTHRYAWELLNGAIPRDREVCHHCDNRRCVNPNHLFLGTHSDNMRDARNKGRIAGQKLLAADVLKIREEGAAGASRTAIAARFGVSRVTVGNVLSGRTWANA